MTKKQADRFLYWLYGWMKRRTTFLRFEFLDEDTLAEYVAYNIDDTIDICDVPIDPLGPILPAVIHEGLHVKYPGKEEAEIEKLTVEVLEKMTLTQFRNLFRRLTEELLNGD